MVINDKPLKMSNELEAKMLNLAQYQMSRLKILNPLLPLRWAFPVVITPYLFENCPIEQLYDEYAVISDGNFQIRVGVSLTLFGRWYIKIVSLIEDITGVIL